MDKVYVVFAGEAYDSERLVSVHASLEGAKAAAHDLAHSGEDGVVYSPSTDGFFWKALSGHYIAVEAKPLAG